MSIKEVLDEKSVKAGLDRIVDGILEDHDLKNTVLIGILTRGATLSKRIGLEIAKKRGVEVRVGFLDTTPHRDDIKKEAIEDKSDIAFNINDRDVILVDDVMSTGRTIRAALDALIDYGRPKTVKTAVLIDRDLRELPISVDYVGEKIPTSTSETIRVRLREIDGGKDGAYIVSK